MSPPEMILRWKPDGTRLSMNQAYCAAFGPREELMRTNLFAGQAGGLGVELERRIAGLTADAPVWRSAFENQLADGSRRWHEWTVTGLFEDDRLIELLSIGRDVTALRTAEAHARRAHRALRTLSHCNQALVRATTEAALLRDICQGIVEHGGYRMTWVGFAEHDDERSVRVVGHAGDDTGYLASLRLSWGDNERGRGPTGQAIRTGRPTRSIDTRTDPAIAPWRADAERLGVRSGVVLPLADAAGAVFGALVVYASEPDAFDDDERRLLAELAGDLAYGICALRTRREHQLAEQSLAGSEALLRHFIKHTPAAVAMFDREMRYLQTSDRWLTDYHLEGPLIGRSHYDVFPDLPERWRAAHQRALAGAVERCDEDPFPRADGTTDWLEWEIRPWIAADGSIGGIAMFTHVITDRKRIAEALRSADDRFRSAMHHSPIGMGIVEPGGRWLEVNPALCAIVGYDRDELVRTDFQTITHPDDLGVDQDLVRRMLSREIETYQLEKRYLHKDGRAIWILLHVSLVWNADGTPRHFIAQIEDIGERKRAHEALRESRARLQLAMEVAKMGHWEYDPATDQFRFDVEDLERLLGARMARDELSSREYMRRFVHPEDQPAMLGAIGDAVRGVTVGEARRLDYRVIRGDGSIGWMSARYEVVADAAGRVVKIFGANQDITEQRAAEIALHESDERLRQLAENLREVVWMSDLAKGEMLYVSPAYETVWGRSVESLLATPMSWLDAVHPDDRDRVQEALGRQLEGLYDEEYRVVRPDGSVRWVHDRAFVIRDDGGRAYRIGGVADDVTERKRIEEQFRQAQKMEAVGQLAGGVAHDFNNILAAIMMQAEEAMAQDAVPASALEFLEEIMRAADRAANLTRQLLQFSRKHVLQPRRIELNELVTNLARMLQRVVREDVAMRLHLHPTSLFTRGDAGMIEQVLMNLAVNARDAMPDGGTLVIETGEVVLDAAAARAIPDAGPGRYVVLRVADAGCGIAAEHLPRIFEPFFTTKEPGKGTGLGLATVFGVVKQHRGWISVSSELGRGTTFQVALPAATEAPVRATGPIAAARPRGGHETILVVEDDPVLRRLTGGLLARHGYTIVEASSGADALRVWAQRAGRVDLVLTDLVMPEGVNGRELAIALQQQAPGLKVILTSGYSADLAGRELQLGRGQNFLQKPCPPADLLDAVRRCLDA